MEPSRTASSGFLKNETVRELVFEDSRQLGGDRFHALYRHSNASIIQGARPAGRAGDIAEDFPGVENHGNRFGRGVAKFGAQAPELLLQGLHHFAGKLVACSSVIAQNKVIRPALAEIAFGIPVLLRFAQQPCHSFVWPQALCGFKGGNRRVRLVEPVVRPTGHGRRFRRLGGNLARPLKHLQRGRKFAFQEKRAGAAQKAQPQQVTLLPRESFHCLIVLDRFV